MQLNNEAKLTSELNATRNSFTRLPIITKPELLQTSVQTSEFSQRASDSRTRPGVFSHLNLTAGMPQDDDGPEDSAQGRCTCTSSFAGEELDGTCPHCNRCRSSLPSSASSCSLLSLESYPVQDYDKLWRVYTASVKGFTIGAGLKGGLALFSVLARLRRRRSLPFAK